MERLPKFAVGEVVILQSTSSPEYNGEDTVVEIIKPGCITQDRIYGGSVKYTFTEGFAYKLEMAIITDIGDNGRPCEVGWDESALRKKQEPGEISFMQLMNSLKIEEKV